MACANAVPENAVDHAADSPAGHGVEPRRPRSGDPVQHPLVGQCSRVAVAVEEEGEHHTQHQVRQADTDLQPAAQQPVAQRFEQAPDLAAQLPAVMRELHPVPVQASPDHGQLRDPCRRIRQAAVPPGADRLRHRRDAVAQAQPQDRDREQDHQREQRRHHGGCEGVFAVHPAPHELEDRPGGIGEYDGPHHRGDERTQHPQDAHDEGSQGEHAHQAVEAALTWAHRRARWLNRAYYSPGSGPGRSKRCRVVQ